jgi:hypothetical protein
MALNPTEFVSFRDLSGGELSVRTVAGGALWALGNHRLLCSDATALADVERVLGGSSRT